MPKAIFYLLKGDYARKTGISSPPAQGLVILELHCIKAWGHYCLGGILQGVMLECHGRKLKLTNSTSFNLVKKRFARIRGTLFGAPHNEDDRMLGSKLGPPYFGKTAKFTLDDELSPCGIAFIKSLVDISLTHLIIRYMDPYVPLNPKFLTFS